MKFTQTYEGRWESDAQAWSAVALNENREPIGIREPRFIIKEGEYKGRTVYRLYEQHPGRKEMLGRFETLEKAIKEVER